LVEQAAGTQVLTVAQAAQTKGVGLATKAQLVWNAAMRANPVGLLITALVALAAAIGVLYLAFRKSEDSVKSWEVALDGTVIKDEKLRESHNESVKTLQQLDVEYKKLTGTLGEYGAEMETVNNELLNQTTLLQQEIDKELSKIEEKYTGFWHKVWVGVKSAVVGPQTFVDDAVAAGKEIYDKTNLYQTKIIDITKEAEARKKNISKKAAMDTAQAVEDFQVSRLKNTISSLDKEYNAAKTAAEKIIAIYKTRTKTVKEIEIELLPETTPEEKKYKEEQKISNELVGQLETLKDQNTELNNQKTVLETSLTNIKLLKIQLEGQLGTTKIIGSVQSQMYKNQKKNIELLKQRYEAAKANMEVLYKNYYGKEMPKGAITLNAPAGADVAHFEAFVKAMDDENKKVLDLFYQATVAQNDLKKIEIDILGKKQEQAEVQKSINDLVKLQKETETKIEEIKPAETDAKKLADVEIATNALANQRKAENNAIYAENKRQLQLSLYKDEARLLELRAQQQQQIADDETRSMEERKNALKERNAIYEQQIILILKQLEIEKQSIQASKTLTEKQKSSAIKVRIEEATAAVQEFRNEIKKADADLDDMFQNNITKILGYVQMGVQVIADFMNTIMSAQLEKIQQQTEENVAIIEDQQSAAIETLDMIYQKGAMSYGDYMREKERIDEEAAAKVKSEKEKAAKKEKEYRMWQAVIGGAGAVVNGLQTVPFLPLGIIMGALAAVLAGVQIAAIASEPLPTFGTGGLVLGKSHAEGGTLAELEDQEFVVQKSVVQRPGMGDFLNGVNQGKIGPGSTSETFNENILRKIVTDVVAGASTIPVINVETEYTGVQRKVKSIESKAVW